MISDVLAQAGEQIDRYLKEFPEVYAEHDAAAMVRSVREQMDNVRAFLDAGPAAGLEDMARAVDGQRAAGRDGKRT